MTELNYLAIAAAAVAAFILSAVWYGVFGRQLAKLNDAYAGDQRMPAWKVLAELVRNLVVATALAGIIDRAGIGAVAGAAALGSVMWLAFPVVILAGSVIHENVPPKLAAIHAGDWLIKLTAISVIVGGWQ